MAARVRASYDDEKLQRKLRDLAEWKEISFAEVIRRFSRLCAVELSVRTQPFGNTSAARQLGQNAIDRDIRKLYKDTATLLDMARSWKDSNWQRAVVTALEKEDFNSLWILLQQTKSWLRDKLVEAPDPAVHKAHRNSRGRVRKSRYFGIVKDAAALIRYIKDRQMMVGFAKSVWWTCAQQIKTDLKRAGAGFPAWVRRHKGPGRIIDNAEDEINPHVVLISNLPWMDDVLPHYEREKAVEIVRQKMFKYIEYTWRGELKARMAREG